MKKYLFTMATAAMLFASCSSDDTVLENGALENQEDLVEIKLGTNSKVGVESRAAVEDLAEKIVGIFVVDRTSMEENNVIKKNIKGTAAKQATDGAYDIALEVENGKKHYYPSTAGKTYDFFGYHPYTNTVGAVAYGNNITVTGTYSKDDDVIAGKADAVPTSDLQAQYAWSAMYYKMHKTAGTTATHPNIKFNHMNARFVIEIVKGSTYEDATCEITDITMKLPESYTLIFANGTTAPTIEYGELGTTAVTVMNDGANGIAPATIADFMIPSNTQSQEFELTFTGREGTTPVTIDFENVKFTDEDIEEGGNVAETMFEAGKIYTITLTIDSPQEITVKGTLKPWVPGGKFELGV